MTNIPTTTDELNQLNIPVAQRNLYVLVVSGSLLGAAMTIYFALLQPLVLQLGGSLMSVGVVSSISGLAMMVPRLIFGEYSDSVGRRRPMLIASLLLIGAGLLFWVAPTWWWLIPVVLITGFAFALNNPASDAATVESVPKSRLGRAFAYRSAGWLLAGVIATVLGIIVVRRHLQNAFLLFTLFSLLNLGVIYFLLKETHISSQSFSPTRLLKNLRQNWRPPEGLKSLYIYVTILDTLAFDTGWYLIYALLSEFQGATSQQILLYSLVTSLVGGLLLLGGVTGRLADWNRKWGMVIADSIAIPTILVCALFPGETVFLLTFVCTGIAGSFFDPAIQAYVADRIPRDRMGAELGKFWSIRGITSLFPPILGGFLATTYGYSAPLIWNVVFGVFSLGFLIWKL